VRSVPAACLALVLGAAPLCAQAEFGAGFTTVLTRVNGVPGGGALTEARVVEPFAFVHATGGHGRLALHAMLDGEYWTMRGGELSLGAFGEGFVDRRHPHTVVHEVVGTVSDLARLPGLHWSLSAGKGFAPFGTDDPMVRPALIYPANHHWSQLLERAVAVAALRGGRAALEAGLFNGDEPENPTQWPRWRRFGDSWAVRLTLTPSPWLELQGSHADVTSPEDRLGAGTTHQKWSASARLERPWKGGSLYALAEWASNSEVEGTFVYHTLLAETQWLRGRHRPYLRIERTERPEDERLADPFRTRRPPLENSIVGTTRWTILTAGYGVRVGATRLPVRPELVGEVAWAHVGSIGGGLFVPRQVYGRNDLLSLSVAVRMSAFGAMHRMGRYGAAEAAGSMGAMGSMDAMEHE